MSVYILGSPGVLTVDQPSPLRSKLGMTWVGTDGSTWNLRNVASGVFLAEGDILGLANGPSQRWTSTAPSVAGSRFRGRRALERPVSWPVAVSVRNGSWSDLARAFFDSLSRDAIGTWTVTLADGSTRRLFCRFDSDGPNTFGLDPEFTGWATYKVELVAEDPYWHGPTVSAQWTTGGSTADFFGGPGGGDVAPPFYLAPGQTLAQASVTNAGSVPAWPVYTISGTSDADPVTAWTVTLGGATLGVSGVSLGAGHTLVVDTDPKVQSSVVDGVRTRGLLSGYGFAPVPAGSTVALALTVSGSGVVTATFDPLYERCI